MIYDKYTLVLKENDGPNEILFSSNSKEECCEALNKYIREMLRKILINKYDIDVIVDSNEKYEAVITSTMITSKNKITNIVVSVLDKFENII